MKLSSNLLWMASGVGVGLAYAKYKKKIDNTVEDMADKAIRKVNKTTKKM